MTKNIGFVSTRFAGTDGVSLESSKWADVLEQNGYRCFWFGGEVDHNAKNTVLVTEAHFKHEQVQWINSREYGIKGRTQTVTRAIHNMRSWLKSRLHDLFNQFDVGRSIFSRYKPCEVSYARLNRTLTPDTRNLKPIVADPVLLE